MVVVMATILAMTITVHGMIRTTVVIDMISLLYVMIQIVRVAPVSVQVALVISIQIKLIHPGWQTFSSLNRG